jgi:alkanesulfonate monooxygenase SsuD/methylene tetrahydromethanopterin reductase-like flavin-dependent oxidoreductase (luciferase family)
MKDLVAFSEAARDLDYTYQCSNDHHVFARPWRDGPTARAAGFPHSGEMRLATTLMVPVLRGPFATAKVLAALDILSGGRVVAGLGPGSSARDYALLGVPFEERFKRLDECIAALRACWRGEPFEGAYYSTGDELLEPRPVQAGGPPIWVGSWGSKAGLRRVAERADGWLASGYNTTPERFEAAWADVRAGVSAAGRDASEFPNGIATMWAYASDNAARAERVLTDVLAPMLNRPVEELRTYLPIGTPERCAERLSAWAAAGAERVFLWPLAEERKQLEVFAERVLPLMEA